MYSNFGMAATSSNVQNSTNGSGYQTASMYPVGMSASQLSAPMYPASMSASQLSAPMYQRNSILHLPAEQYPSFCLYDTRRSYVNRPNFHVSQAQNIMNYSTGTEVNNISSNYSTGTVYDCNNPRSSSTKRNSYGNNLMTSQNPSQLPIECWTNEQVLAAANLSAAEAEELLASVHAEIAAKKSYGDLAATNGTISMNSNHSRDKSAADSHRFGSCVQQSTSTSNNAGTSSIQFDYEPRVSQLTDSNYLPSCQFSNQPNNNNWSFSNRQTQDQLNGNIKTQSQESQRNVMMSEYHLQGHHHRQNRITTVYNPDTAFPPNFSKSPSQRNYDFSQASDQSVANYNFSQAFDQGVSNHNFAHEFYKSASTQAAYPAQNELQSCNEVTQPLSNLIPVLISNTQAQESLSSNLATIFAVHQAPVVTSRKISSTARDAMMAWFEENKHHPYPDPDEYKSFVAVGGTTYSQAVKWFANRRKRTGTCKTIPEYVQGRREKPVKPAGGNENVVPVTVNRKRLNQNDDDNVVGQPKEKKSRKM